MTAKRLSLIAALLFALVALSPAQGESKALNWQYEDGSFNTGTCATGAPCQD